MSTKISNEPKTLDFDEPPGVSHAYRKIKGILEKTALCGHVDKYPDDDSLLEKTPSDPCPICWALANNRTIAGL